MVPKQTASRLHRSTQTYMRLADDISPATYTTTMKFLPLILDMFPFQKLPIVASNKHWQIFYSRIANLKQNSPNALYPYKIYRKFNSCLIPIRHNVTIKTA